MHANIIIVYSIVDIQLDKVELKKITYLKMLLIYINSINQSFEDQNKGTQMKLVAISNTFCTKCILFIHLYNLNEKQQFICICTIALATKS